ncbi:MAG: IS630 family transposase [gamma proteobacterium endosymbiont of Lamellibrachia anaximandri]|nr:IS630 family transposase [gamma proteobacterium endosymbiont of Lamellibrachia anaximandri]
MNSAVTIYLTPQEQTALQKNVRSRKTSIRLIERSKIILLAVDGLSNIEIAEQLNISAHKVGRWRNRYAEFGFPGIEKELPRGGNQGGKKTADQTRLRSKIIQTTTQTKPQGATHWSTRTLAKELGTTHSFVNRVWQESGLKPHLTKGFKVSNDPKFEEKLVDVIGLYLSLPENAAVFCVDEKSSIQALDRTQPGLPMKKGRAGTMTHDYKRHGTSTLFAALDVASGEVIGECKSKHRHQEFLSFLKTVEKQTPKELELHLIVDNSSFGVQNSNNQFQLHHHSYSNCIVNVSS